MGVDAFIQIVLPLNPANHTYYIVLTDGYGNGGDTGYTYQLQVNLQ